MWFTRTADGFRGWLPVEQSNGSLRTGLAAGDFVATIVNPADSSTSILTVAQSTKTGLYRFDVPSAFLVTNGVGEYGVVVEIDTFAGPSGAPHVRTTFGAVLKVSIEDFDSLGVTVAAILTDTAAIDARLPADPADESNQLAAHAVTQADVAGVQSDTDNIQTRLPTALNAGRMRSHIEAMNADVITSTVIATDAIGADELATSAVNEIRDSIISDGTPFRGADIARILGLAQDNYMLDNTSYDANGLLLTGRVRVFASAVALAAATDGAADGADSEIARYSVTTIAAVSGQADDYRFEREL